MVSETLMSALSPGRCAAETSLRDLDTPDYGAYRCTKIGGHPESHEHRRGFWLIVVWTDETTRFADTQ